MSRTRIGRVCVAVKGTWQSSEEYEILDIVANGGGSYIAKKNVPAGTAITNTEFWIQITDKGDTGAGISTVAKTSTSGNVDTYTITMTDGSTSTFTVTNTNILGETSATKTAIGSDAAPNSTGNSVVAVGRTALYALTTGAQNTAVGAGAANSLTTGQSNTVIGAAAGTAAATTNYGTAVGRTAVTGADSVAIGANAKASGAYGTAVGYGTEVTASRGTAIGAGTKANFAGSVAIGQDSSGNSATASANNEMVIGTAAHKVKIPGTQYDGMFKASIPNPTYSEELAPALSSWTGTDAEYSDGKWTVATGGTISTTIECEAEADYLIKLTERIDGVEVKVENAVTPNEIPRPCTISLGSASLSIFGANDANWYVVLQPTAGGNLTLTIGGGEWSGTIPYVSVKKITSYANTALNVQDKYIAMPSSSVVVGNGFAKQGVTDANNVAVGYHSQEYAQSGKGNVGVGLYTQQNIKNGSHNVAVGESAQRYLETGMYNFAVGYSAQSKLKSGCWNVAMGNEAQRDLTTGCNNVSLGRRAHNNITTGNKNVAIGAQAGFVRATNPDNPDVTSEAYATKTGAEQVLIGFQATQTQNSQGTADGAIAIGARAMANTDGIAIGRDVKASAPGSIAIGRDSQGNSAEANNADEIVIGTENHTIKLGGKPVNEFAVIDGSYDGMTVGSAQQLLASSGVEDRAPYAYRTSGGSMDIGDREELNEIDGMTVVWNQLLQNGNFADTTKWAALSGSAFAISDGAATFTAIQAGGGMQHNVEKSYLMGHKILGILSIKATANVPLTVQFVGSTKAITGTGSYQEVGVIENVTTTASRRYYPRIADQRSSDWDEVSVNKVMTFDLTAMFGATIADYVYSLEQAQAGAGVAWFRDLFPNSYYAYSAPTLMSVKTSGHKTVGFNQFDEETVMPTTGAVKQSDGSWYWATASTANGKRLWTNTLGYTGQICITATVKYSSSVAAERGVVFRVYYMDGTNEYKSPSVHLEWLKVSLLTNTNKVVDRIEFTYAKNTTSTWMKDICVNLSWSGTRNGEYEAYVEHEYPLDSSLELRGIPKLDSNNKLYADGDIYAPSGNVIRKYGIVDLGSLTWVMSTVTEHKRFQANNLHALVKFSTDNIICSKYLLLATHTSNFVADKVIATSGSTQDSGRLWIWDDDYSTEAAFTTAMSGVYLVYELATSTTETADPYQQAQVVNDWGTEEFIDSRDVAIPVGHKTTYLPNLRDKLQHLPSLASDDGYYLISQQNNTMSLELFRIPKAPSEDGTYQLKATVTSGTPTYFWEAIV